MCGWQWSFSGSDCYLQHRCLKLNRALVNLQSGAEPILVLVTDLYHLYLLTVQWQKMDNLVHTKRNQNKGVHENI